jgi:hypothetical protein
MSMMRHFFVLPLVFLILTSSCASAVEEAVPTSMPTMRPSETAIPATSTSKRVQPSLESVTQIPGKSTPTLAVDAWMQMPVIPTTISDRVVDIYQHGLALGNNPQAFSKIGDCDATPAWFLGDFDEVPGNYSLGDYAYLEPVIDHFKGSWGRTSVAVARGFTAASVLTPLWADPKLCQANETPLDCELRLHRPSFAIILLGTNDVNHLDVFEPNMRIVIETLIDRGVVPILATKADNLEGDHEINATIAQLAHEYDIPLWNFWLAVQPLPNHGLQKDDAHLTFAGNNFDDPVRMQSAWPWRNLTTLQTLDTVWRAVTAQH